MIVPLVVYLLGTPFLIQKLGSAQYGVLTLLLTITTLLAALDFGLGSGGVRGLGQVLIAEERVIAARFLREVLTLFFLAGMLFAGMISS